MKKLLNNRRINSAGFTLLELLIVIAIAAILIAVASASYSTAQRKARDAKRMGDMKAIQNAAEQYYSDNSAAYPPSTADFGSYLPAGFPNDPKCPGGTCASGYNNYVYTPGGTTYFSCAQLESLVGNATGINGTGFGSTSTGQYYCAKNLQ